MSDLRHLLALLVFRPPARASLSAIASALLLALPAGARAPQDGSTLLDRPRDVSAEGHAFVAVEVASELCYVGQEVRVRISFGFEERFAAHNLLQLFQRRLDVPAQLEVPWGEELPGPAAADRERVAFALGEGLAEGLRAGERVRDGRRYEVVELERGVVLRSAGTRVLAAPRLRFAYATRFAEDLVRGRVPADRVEAFVAGNEVTLHAEPLPEEGRPPDFGGAVGRFDVRAEATPRALRVGESLRLVLRVEGEGRMDAFEPPRLDALRGFHVRGRTDEVRGSMRELVVDLAPVSEQVREVPAIRFAFFDPGPPAGYRSASTEPIPLDVRPAAEGAAGEGKDAEDAEDATAPPATRIVLSILTGLAVLWLAARAWSRSRARPSRERARLVAAAVRAHRRRGEHGAQGEDAAGVLATFLAGCAGCSVPAMIGGDVARRLATAGVPEELAGRAARLLDELLAARYGGRPVESPGGLAAVDALVDDLERAVARRGA